MPAGYVFRRIGGRVVPIVAKTAHRTAKQAERIVAKSGASESLASRLARVRAAAESNIFGQQSPLRFAGVPSNKPVPLNIVRREALSLAKAARKKASKLRKARKAGG